MNSTKTIFESKTVWLNVITFALAVVALPEFISLLPLDALPYIALLNSLGNIILRVYFTTQPIENESDETDEQ